MYLSTADLRQAGFLGGYAQRMTGEVSWPLSDGSSLGKVRLDATVSRRGERAIFLHRRVLNFGGKNLLADPQIIPLAATRPHFGGNRLWFVCECGRRAGKLYLPTGETVFRCRICYDLSYRSCQEHNTERANQRHWLETFRHSLEHPAEQSWLRYRSRRKLRDVTSTAK